MSYSKKFHHEEVPVLAINEITVLNSDYINAFDEALSVLEESQQFKPENIIDNKMS